jgi:hypothetical protein
MFKNKKRVIVFEPEVDYFPGILPTKKFIPDWYKDAKPYKGDDLNFHDLKSQGLKACVPFLEPFLTGYCISTPVDIVVKKINEFENMITWGPDIKILTLRDQLATPTLPVPNGYQDKHYAWITQVSFQLPKGYSAVMTHPLNRYDLPFLTLSGIVDADKPLPGGNISFFLKEDFEGVIPAGTPIIQIIPFKRENWNSENKDGLAKIANKSRQNSLVRISGWYKNNIWTRKVYE